MQQRQMTEPPATASNPNAIPRAALVVAIVLMLAPGSFFFAKGAVEVADRYAPRTLSAATITSTALGATVIRGRQIPVHEVRGATVDGQRFSFDDREVYELSQGRTPLAVQVELSTLTQRVIGVRVDDLIIRGVGGATKLWLALLGLGLGLALSLVPLLMPWQTEARKQARRDGMPMPRPDLGAVAIVLVAALAFVGGTLAWDLLR